MQVARFCGAGIWLLIACSRGDGPFEPLPDNHELIILETIPYDALGSTRLTFRRDQDDKRGIVSLDGSTRTGSVTYSTMGTWVAASPNSDDLAYIDSRPIDDPERAYDVFIRDWAANVGISVGGPGGMRDTPSWTPNGSRIIYGEADDDFSLSSTRVVTQSPVPDAIDRQVLWSATGTCEFLDNPRQNAAGALVFVYSLGDPTNCFANYTRIARVTPGGEARTIYGHGTLVYAPAWSPSGTEIAFFETTGPGQAPTVTVKRMAADGSNVRTIAVIAYNGTSHEQGFSMCWSEDGSRIFFNLPDSPNESHIYGVTVSSGAVTQITTAAGTTDWSLSCS